MIGCYSNRIDSIAIFVLCLLGCVNVLQAKWPCVASMCPKSKAFPSGKPCTVQEGCPNPDCDKTKPNSDQNCLYGPTQYKCLDSGQCEDLKTTTTSKQGATCSNSRDCGPMLVCQGGKCVGGRVGSFKNCMGDSDCQGIEKCEDGVCLLPSTGTAGGKYTDPSVPAGFQPDPTKFRGPCDTMSNPPACPNPQDLICVQGECYPRSLISGIQPVTAATAAPTRATTTRGTGRRGRRGRRKGVRPDTRFRDDGVMMPPGAGMAGCRDALMADGTSDCATNADLCTDSLYRDLMEEQCPMTCGLCTGGRVSRTGRRGKREALLGPRVKREVCEDIADNTPGRNCASFADLCNEPVYYDLMTEICRKTCNRCSSTSTTQATTATGECKDKTKPGTNQSDCPGQRHLCGHPFYIDLMRDQCPVTCGYCGTMIVPIYPIYG
ncbi:shK domain-like domain-containing protein [Ditylenchus destructor]|nr:shK domain-like domain-containing protein [Ditylenchus destructor]